MSFRIECGSYYRMPAIFGPTPGPRQWTESEGFDPAHQSTLTVGVHFLTQAEQLEHFLPPGFRLWGEPVATLNLISMKNIAWLAGRGYNVSDFRFPAIYEGSEGPVHGTFVAVRWENMADPILSGRDELGHSKLWCEIPDLAPDPDNGTGFFTSLSWLGFEFANLSIWDMEDAEMPVADALDQGELHYKYVPRTGHPGEADAAYPVLSPSLYSENMKIERRQTGRGAFIYRSARWRDFPFAHHVVSAIAGLPIVEWRGSDLTESRGSPSRPGEHTRILA